MEEIPAFDLPPFQPIPPKIKPSKKIRFFPILIGLFLASIFVVGMAAVINKDSKPDPYQSGVQIGYSQYGILYLGTKGTAITNVMDFAAQHFPTNQADQESFLEGYRSGCRTAQNIVQKYMRDQAEFQDRIEHPTGY